MAISEKINLYLENSKLNGKLCRWYKPVVNVYITPIVSAINNKEFYYSEISRAIQIWNNILRNCNINLSYQITNTPNNADIVIHWTKVGIKFEGMCKYPSIINNELKKIYIDIGMPNSLSGKNTTNESIFFVIMHELGHSLGLGHGVEVDDLMYVPHQKNISVPSENDIYILKQIYNQ